jgi:arginyl-tRNA--protein-N-Asp/Glu arginylyltransferase
MYNRHKFDRGLARSDEPIDADGYVGWLVDSCMPTLEMRYYLEDHLVGVGIVDAGATALSSVYFFFDPAPRWSKYSPGVYSILREIELCRETGRQHLYLGLYVEDCRHLAYKADYLPHEQWLGGAWKRFGRGDLVDGDGG